MLNKNDYIKHKIKKYYNKKSSEKKCMNRYTLKRKEDVMIRITDSLSRRIYEELKRLNIKRTFKYNDLLGCSLEEFKKYLQNKFKPNMTFDNYGEWEVDHIVAFSKFDFNNEEDIKT